MRAIREIPRQWAPVVHRAVLVPLIAAALPYALSVPAAAADRPGDLGPTLRPHELKPEDYSVEFDGQVYGARPSDRGPIGGGKGYHNILTDGKFRVSDAEGLIEALEQASAGDVVFVEGDARIDMTVWVYVEKRVLEIPEGVTLASNRGHDGSEGALIFSDTFETRPLIRATGPGVRVTGLRIRGPDPQRRMALHRRSFSGNGKGRAYYYAFPTSRGIDAGADGLEVDNCELWGWSHSAVNVGNGRDARVHHSHIHHNQRHGLGYGVTHDQGTSLIEYNLFDYNRHAIAGTGREPSGYEASHNIVLHHANGHHFDMHGGRDRGDGTNVAGSWMKVQNNTFIGHHVAAVVIRGVPEREAVISRNWFFHEQPGHRVNRSDGRTTIHNNVYGNPPSPPVDD